MFATMNELQEDKDADWYMNSSTNIQADKQQVFLLERYAMCVSSGGGMPNASELSEWGVFVTVFATTIWVVRL